MPNGNTLRDTKRTRSGEKAKLKTVAKDIAKDIANGTELSLVWNTEENPTPDRIEQTEKSNLAFLFKLCSDHGLALKIHDGQIVIFDETNYTKRRPPWRP